MTHSKSLILFLGLALSFTVHAQKEVLMTVNKKPVYTSEFKRVYLKNIDLVKDESQKDVEEYLDLFINYKLKLEEARTLELDQKEKYIKELAGYKDQLKDNYLTDRSATEALIKEAYDRSLYRVKASHILIAVKPNAAPQDTLAAYQKISEARTKVLDGGDFSSIAKQYSQDPSAKSNGGALGWFSIFRMVYPFETAAYTTEVGKVSQPFRTQFGYHIVKVEDKEKTLGEVEVAHIMVAKSAKRTIEQAGEKIKEINQQLIQGASFEALAKEYSDDRNTAVNGGKINKFGQGGLNSVVFEKAAFSLKEKGEMSGPIKTKYGWHIIKLIDKFPPKSFNEQKLQLTRLVKRDSRSQLVTDAFMNSLRDKYGVKINKDAITYFQKTIPSTVLNENWEIPEKDKAAQELFSVKNEKYTYKDFAEYLKEHGSQGRKIKDVSAFVAKLYKDYESSNLLRYYKDHLEEDNEDYANVLAEYRDGLLLFDLMESRVWNVAKVDSIGLKAFFEKNKDQYAKGETYSLIKASSTESKVIKKIKKLLEQGADYDVIKEKIEGEMVIFSEAELEKGKDKLPKGFSGKLNEVVELEDNGYNTVMKVIAVTESKLRTFDEAKGKVINDYQDAVEKEWLDQLRQKYEVDVNAKTLKKIKKEL